MKILVQKFGGSSLANRELRHQVAQHVLRAKDEGFAPVVVVSALGRRGDPYATDTLIDLAHSVNSQPDKRNLDLLMSVGEMIAAVVMAETLNTLGHPACALTGWQCGVFTDEQYGNARITSIKANRIHQVIAQGYIPVVTGFQGVTSGGEVTTLGRGGSDTTAVALGVVLNSPWVEIYTDVDGIKTADPRIIPEAPTIANLTYREVMEMAHLGAKVIHPRAVEIAMEEGIVLKILSTTDAGTGTVIGQNTGKGGERIGDRVVTGIAHITNRAQVRITGDIDFNQSRLGLKVFEVLAENGISVDLIYLSPDLIAFIIDNDKSDHVKEVLADLGLNIQVKTGFAKVSVVGAGMHGVPGVMARIVSCLESANVPIYQTTDSHANISCLVEEKHLPVAIRALYQEFQLSKEEGSKK